jgi:hypothetical protein
LNEPNANAFFDACSNAFTFFHGFISKRFGDFITFVNVYAYLKNDRDFGLLFTVNDVIADDAIFVILLPITFASV